MKHHNGNKQHTEEQVVIEKGEASGENKKHIEEQVEMEKRDAAGQVEEIPQKVTPLSGGDAAVDAAIAAGKPGGSLP